MATDDERQCVALRLLEYVDLPDDWWQETRADFYISKCVFRDVLRHSEGELFARLADLIEPSCDRDALLELAEDVDGAADDSGGFEPLAGMLRDIARRIREALGVSDG